MSTLTAAEKEIVDDLALVWNKFLALPVEQQMSQERFLTLIQNAQDHVLARPAIRAINSPPTPQGLAYAVKTAYKRG